MTMYLYSKGIAISLHERHTRTKESFVRHAIEGEFGASAFVEMCLGANGSNGTIEASRCTYVENWNISSHNSGGRSTGGLGSLMKGLGTRFASGLVMDIRREPIEEHAKYQ